MPDIPAQKGGLPRAAGLTAALVGWAAPEMEVDVKALVFRHSLAREAASAIGGRVDPRAFVSRLAPVRIEDVDELPLPPKDWVRVETTFSGLCGSDVKQILLNGARDNPLTALVSFPHVLGHEAVGRRRGHRGARRAQPVAVVRPARHRAAVRSLRGRPLSLVPQFPLR